ncbi:MAG: methylated-DNA--[protein]-cysteine S-methyltransferase [Beijerinckiaceae bacterium]|nr:methylated-DNA--[protein]-cysteine S-methyltransferase [Beijerinckiaceae bacterium]
MSSLAQDIASPTPAPTKAAAPGDYDLIRRAIAFMAGHWRDHPLADELAAGVGVDQARLEAALQRWAGLTPDRFASVMAAEHARTLLREASRMREAVEPQGQGSRDLFVRHEALPQDERNGLSVRYGFHDSPFGRALVMTAKRGLCGLAFNDDGEDEGSLLDMTRRWPYAAFTEDRATTGAIAHRVFEPAAWRADQPMPVVLIGTAFEISVWERLLRIPLGGAATYAHIAASIGRPSAARAVGAAVGKNPISFVVPCHRVLGASGALTGYHWGVARKQAMLGWEAGWRRQP